MFALLLDWSFAPAEITILSALVSTSPIEALTVPCNELISTITAAMKNDEMAIPRPVRIYLPLDARRFARATVFRLLDTTYPPTAPWPAGRRRGWG